MKLKIRKQLNKILFIFRHHSINIAINLFFFLTISYSLNFQPRFCFPIALVQIILLTFPVFYKKLDKKSHFLTKRYSELIKYNWNGFLRLYFFSNIFLFIFFILLKITGSNLSFSRMFPTSFGLALFLSIYGLFEASHIRVKKLELQSDKISRNYSIVHFSDLHLSHVTWESRILTMIRYIKNISPDILISSGDLVDGDLVDGDLDKFTDLIDELADIKPTFGKYATTGKHKIDDDLEKAIKYTEKAGFEILHDKLALIDNDISILGFNDNTVKNYDTHKAVEHDLLNDKKIKDTFKILIKHRPKIIEENIDLFDIQLSGHTNKSLIYPFNHITRKTKRFDHGLYNLSDKSLLYVSNGVGTWGPSFRFMVPPEITHIVLIAK